MKARSLLSLATAVGLSVASIHADTTKNKKSETAKPAVKTEAPVTKPVIKNQDLADAVANHLRSSGLGMGASIQISTTDGVVEITGKIPTAEHGNKVLQCVMQVPGVKRIQSTLEVVGPITRISGATPMESVTQPMPMMPNQMMPNQMAMQGGVMPTMMMGGGAMPSEPSPLAMPNFPAYDPNGPVLPANAWPTYAPYPNISRVAYPEAYPYNAFPYIGPFYPFPKVPLGWRSVKLEWEDGHWYFGKIATPHDYWRVRFW